MGKVTVGDACPVHMSDKCYAGCMFFDHVGKRCSVAAGADELLDNLMTQHERAVVKAPGSEEGK